MGTYRITIEGTGSHHNVDYPADADQVAARAVTELKRSGHDVRRAVFELTDHAGAAYRTEDLTGQKPAPPAG
jgi:hypothetical protein